tara:strand:- start:6352 stop:6627 length:276 start_codon:yes stop_codon:yes gene_type:complete
MNINEISIHRLVPIYLMSSYLYYRKDSHKLSDGEFDTLCKRMLDNWTKIRHPHKRLIKKKDLEAGTGYAIKKYPTIVMSSAERWLAGEYDD